MKKTFSYFLLFLLFFAGSDVFCQHFGMGSDTSRAEADSIMKAIHRKAMAEKKLGRYENAEILYRDVVRLKETYASDQTELLLNVYSNYISILNSIWKYDEANAYWDKVDGLSKFSDTKTRAIFLYSRAQLNLYLKDGSAALEYIEQAEKIMLRTQPLDLEFFKSVYYSKSSAYFLLGRYDEGLECFDIMESSLYLTSKEKFDVNIKRFTFYFNQQNNEKASALYDVMNNSGISKEEKNYLNLQYATLLYYNLKKIDEAILIFKELEKTYTKSHRHRYEAYQVLTNLGNCYESKKMYKETLEYYQKTLQFRYPGFTDPDFKYDPPVSDLKDAQNVVLIKNKAEVLYQYSKSTNDTSYLSASLRNCFRSLDVIQKSRFRVTSEESQFLISKNERLAYGLTQMVALEKYKLTNDEKYLNMAFVANEKSRAFTLLSSMRNQKAMDFGNIPSKIRNQENELNRQISLYDELLYKENMSPDPDPVKVSNWEDLLFEASEDYALLLRKLERQYPEYYRLKFDDKVSDMFEIQKNLENNTVLIEYSFLDSLLIIYTISPEKLSAKKVYLNPGFEDKCITFIDLITNKSFTNEVTETYCSYLDLAYELYTTLIKPIEDDLNGNNLIVIPDGAISYIPFDALLTAKVPHGTPNYRNIPYLVKDFSVGYAYSSTIHFNPLKHVKIPSEKILAFAPAYAKASDDSTQLFQLRNQDYLDLDFLPGVSIEVNNISELYKTEAYYHLNAKESVFKELAGRYRVLHLAMHTKIDNANPMLSRLVFTQIPDGDDDAMLYTYEIYNLKLNANLTVLSSCSSGYGKVQPGEGVQSLARGFAFAGCPSVLMTLWSVADLSSVLIITDFYKHLVEQKSKPMSLRESKLNFLANADELRAHPYFWASYVIIGDPSPLISQKTDMAAFNAVLLLLPLGFLSVYYRKFKKDEKKQMPKSA